MVFETSFKNSANALAAAIGTTPLPAAADRSNPSSLR